MEKQKLFTKFLTTSTDVKIDEKEKSEEDIIAWSCEMQSHARKCVERHRELAHKTVDQLYQSLFTLFRRSSN